MSFLSDASQSPMQQPKFRILYVENCSNISSHKPLFTGSYAHLDEIKERLAQFIPSHPLMTLEYYNKKFGLRNRKQLEADLPPDLEDIYVYIRSKKPMTCHVCDARCVGGAGAANNDNHEHK